MLPFCQSVVDRNLQPELMDRPDLDASRHRQALRGLSRINFWSRSAEILWKPLSQLYRDTRRSLRVLDIASGGGDVLCRLARKAQRSGLPMQFTGCDRSSQAMEYASELAEHLKVDVDFFIADAIKDSLPSGYDVLMSSLFLHHLTEEQAVKLLSRMAQHAEKLILINDLIRSQPGHLLALVGTKLLSASHVVHFDGPRSVEGAFTVQEVRGLAARAGLAGVSVVERWPRRFLLSWQKV